MVAPVDRLTIYDGKEPHAEHLLQRDVTSIGRHPKNDLVLADPTLSRYHARIEKRQQQMVLVVEDGAQNGLMLNGQRLLGEKSLRAGDKIQLGRYTAVFHHQDDDGALASPKPTPRPAATPPLHAAHTPAPSQKAKPAPNLELDVDLSELDDSAPAPRAKFGGEESERNSAALRELEEALSGSDVVEAAPTVLPKQQRRSSASTALGLPQRTDTPAMMGMQGPALVLLHNGKEVSRHALAGDVSIGRSKTCGVVIPSMSLSRKHATIVKTREGFRIHDEGSRNGTWVNNNRVDNDTLLQDGDLLNFYEYGLLFLEDGRTKLEDEPGDDDLIGPTNARPTTPKQEPVHESPDFGPGSLLEDEGVGRPQNALLDEGLLDESADFQQGADTKGQLARLANQTSMSGGPGTWPNDEEVERALAVSIDYSSLVLDVSVSGKRVTSAPLVSMVTRVGTDPRCELALPRSSKARGWHVTLLSMGGAVLLQRVQQSALVHVNGKAVDAAVLQPGDQVTIGSAVLNLRQRR
jgi:pSer/pThr/pTyr-binding forkhead associated (FHA) protein